MVAYHPWPAFLVKKIVSVKQKTIMFQQTNSFDILASCLDFLDLTPKQLDLSKAQ